MRYYRSNLDVFLEKDTSSVAIGMALLQSDSNKRESLYPKTYGSKTLADAETRYANIEKKLLGVVGALEEFHYFKFGRWVTILTDHKTLIAISKKALVNAPHRLQRLLLRPKNYNIDLHWIPGKEMIFSVHLSRNMGTSGKKPYAPTSKGLDLKIQDVYLNMSSDKCMSLATETNKDEVLSTLKNQIIKSWPVQRG